MAVYSMTGFATAAGGPALAGTRGSGTVSAELRSVNGRFLDLSLRLPDELRALEPALRQLVASGIRRGKVELRVSTLHDEEEDAGLPRPEALQALHDLEAGVRGVFPDARGLSVGEVLQWCRGRRTAVPLDDVALDAVRRCVEGLREARAREGERLAEMLRERIHRLRALTERAQPLLPQVVQRQQQRFIERWNEALASAPGTQPISAQALQERALNEAAAYAIRIDVAEELTRLCAHLDEIERLLHTGGELGKRLDFLIQELQREANTLGSKSAALELTAISVEMKVAIEQMREQVQNLE